jgi:DNA-directed RNA polymerase subunit F
MIKDQKPLTYGEVVSLIGDGEKATKVKEFIKEFYKIKPEKAKAMKEELIELKMIKLKEEHIVNIVNFLPSDASDILKIVPDASLEQEEINKILDIVKKY